MLKDAQTKENELAKRGFGFFPQEEKDPGLKNPTFIKKLNEYAGTEIGPKHGIELRNILQLKAGRSLRNLSHTKEVVTRFSPYADPHESSSFVCRKNTSLYT